MNEARRAWSFTPGVGGFLSFFSVLCLVITLEIV